MSLVQHEEEAEAIARLVGQDPTRTVGWVYLWNTSALSVLWIERPSTASFIEPSLEPEVLVKAKSVTPAEVTEFLEALSPTNGENPKW